MANNLSKKESESNLISKISYALKSENFATEAEIFFTQETLTHQNDPKTSVAGTYYNFKLSFNYPKLTAETVDFFNTLMKDDVIIYVHFANAKKITLGDDSLKNFPVIVVPSDGEQINSKYTISVDYNSLKPITYS